MRNNVRRLVVSEELLLQLFSAGEHRGYSITANAIPADARVVNVHHGWPDGIEILLESPEFSPVKEGDEIPFLTPICFTTVALESHDYKTMIIDGEGMKLSDDDRREMQVGGEKART